MMRADWQSGVFERRVADFPRVSICDSAARSQREVLPCTRPPRMAREEDRMDRFNLGAYRRPISTRSAETQRWFDIGLNWCYGFNHEEGIKCFERALESDPGCAM